MDWTKRQFKLCGGGRLTPKFKRASTHFQRPNAVDGTEMLWFRWHLSHVETRLNKAQMRKPREIYNQSRLRAENGEMSRIDHWFI